MEVNLGPETQAKVNRAAAANESSAAEYVRQLVESYVDHDAWFRHQVREGLDQRTGFTSGNIELWTQ